MPVNYFKQLQQLLDGSYAPYSGFNVAAIVISRDGRLFKGVNVESAACPTTICAERNAICLSGQGIVNHLPVQLLLANKLYFSVGANSFAVKR